MLYVVIAASVCVVLLLVVVCAVCIVRRRRSQWPEDPARYCGDLYFSIICLSNITRTCVSLKNITMLPDDDIDRMVKTRTTSILGDDIVCFDLLRKLMLSNTSHDSLCITTGTSTQLVSSLPTANRTTTLFGDDALPVAVQKVKVCVRVCGVYVFVVMPNAGSSATAHSVPAHVGTARERRRSAAGCQPTLHDLACRAQQQQLDL
jgi:hypothetical protein